jgi:hypothetical protein
MVLKRGRVNRRRGRESSCGGVGRDRRSRMSGSAPVPAGNPLSTRSTAAPSRASRHPARGSVGVRSAVADDRMDSARSVLNRASTIPPRSKIGSDSAWWIAPIGAATSSRATKIGRRHGYLGCADHRDTRGARGPGTGIKGSERVRALYFSCQHRPPGSVSVKGSDPYCFAGQVLRLRHKPRKAGGLRPPDPPSNDQSLKGSNDRATSRHAPHARGD